jgi:pimeloyl-ACP methyl ester carboxylesterase
LDHSLDAVEGNIFNIRYIVDDVYFKNESLANLSRPILFYAGNEGDVEGFYNNSGFMTKTLAERWGGLVVFGEHRYFGQSFPFPKDIAFTSPYNTHLTVENVMVDYVKLIESIKEQYNAQDKPVIVFGGSYGGMLAAWLRMKYPHTFQGALAASAPTVYFKGSTTAG